MFVGAKGLLPSPDVRKPSCKPLDKTTAVLVRGDAGYVLFAKDYG